MNSNPKLSYAIAAILGGSSAGWVQPSAVLRPRIAGIKFGYKF